jgi:hypothetical protein
VLSLQHISISGLNIALFVSDLHQAHERGLFSEGQDWSCTPFFQDPIHQQPAWGAALQLPWMHFHAPEPT